MAFIDPDSIKGFIDPDAPKSFVDPDSNTTILAPAVVVGKEVPTAGFTPQVPKKTPGIFETFDETVAKPIVGEALAATEFIASIPEFITKVAGQAYLGASQLVTSGKVDFKLASEDASRIASPLGIPARSIEPLAELFGVKKEYQDSLIKGGLNNVGEFLEFAADKIEKSGGSKLGFTKEANMAVFETMMITGVPGLRPLSRKASEGIKSVAETPYNNAIVGTNMAVDGVVRTLKKAPETAQDIVIKLSRNDLKEELAGEVNVPAIDANLDALPSGTAVESLADSLYALIGHKKADNNAVVSLERELDKAGVTQELKDKFRLYAEDTARGNELIVANVSELKSDIKAIHELNKRLYEQADLRSSFNPEGTTLWKDFPYKEEIKANKEKIKELESQIETNLKGYKNVQPLNFWELELFNKTYKPYLENISKLTNYAIDAKLIDPLSLDPALTGAHFPRRGMPDMPKGIDWLIEKISGDDSAIGIDYQRGKLPSAAKDRALFVHELPNGLRKVIGFKGDSIVEWRNGKSIPYLKRAANEYKSGDRLGAGIIKEATLAEVSTHTPFKYSENSSLVLKSKDAEMRDLVRRDMWQDSFLDSNVFKQNAELPQAGKEVVGRRYLSPEAMAHFPKLKDYVYDNRIAEVIDDYAKRYEPNPILSVSNALITNMMLVPLKHIYNEVAHWSQAGGYRFATGLPEAVQDVMTNSEFYQELTRKGGSNLASNTRNNYYMNKAFEEGMARASADPTMGKILKAFGKTPLDFYKEVSLNSNRVMWTTRDILYTHLVKEKMKRHNLTMEQAIKDVERHMPNYRLPTRVGEEMKVYKFNVPVLGKVASRSLSKVLQNPNLTVFSRYHHGRESSMLNALKDALLMDNSRTKTQQFKDFVEYAIPTIGALYVILPLLDKLFQSMTGDSEAEVVRPGGLHVINTVKEVSEGKKDLPAVGLVMVTPNPVLQYLVQMFPLNYELYNGKKILNLEDLSSAEGARLRLNQFIDYTAKQPALVGQGLSAAREDTGGGWQQFLLNQLGVNVRTSESRDRMEDRQERALKEYENKLEELE